MKKMRGIVALCAALTMGLGSPALLAQQKPDNRKEVKRGKAEQIDFDTLVNLVDGVAAGRAGAPSPGIPVTGESNHFFRAPDGSTYVPFTITLDKGQLAAPDSAVYLAAFPKGAAPAAPAKNSKDKTAGPTPAFEKFEFTQIGADGKLSRYMQVKPGDYDVYLAVKDK